MIQRYYDGADERGKGQIDKVLMALCGKSMIGLDLALDEKPDVVITGILTEAVVGYKVGAEVICSPDLTYGLIKEEGDEYWGNFVYSGRIKIDCIDFCDEIKSTETLSILAILTMKKLLKLPVNYFD